MTQGFISPNSGITLPLGVTSGGTGLGSTTINQILYSSSANVITGIATANNSLLQTSAAGVPSMASFAWVTYTPTITLVGGAGNTVPTYTTVSSGRYCRIGNMITVIISFVNTAGGTAGAGTGQINIALPVASGANMLPQLNPIGRLVQGGNTYQLLASIDASQSTVQMYYLNVAVLTVVSGADQSNSTRVLQITLTYEV